MTTEKTARTAKKAKKTVKTAHFEPEPDFPIICATCGGNITHKGVLAENGQQCTHCAR